MCRNGEKEKNYVFNDVLDTLYLRLHSRFRESDPSARGQLSSAGPLSSTVRHAPLEKH